MVSATGPGKKEKRVNPPSLMLYNFDIDGFDLKEEHKDFLRLEALPTLRAGGSVSVIGLTDRKGSSAHNQWLSEQRAAKTVGFLREEAANGFNVNQSTGFGEAAAVREGDAYNTLDERFRTVLLFLSNAPDPPNITAVKSQTVQVAVKSFIAVIGSRVGTMAGWTYLPFPIPPIFLRPGPRRRQDMLEELAKETDKSFSEDPRTTAKDKHYRLLSSCNFSVSWSDGKLVSVAPSVLDSDGGKEGLLQPPDLIVTPVTTGMIGASIFTFSWEAKGRPHLLAEPFFQSVQPRTSFYIWHAISGRIDVSSGTPMTTGVLRGSEFPSHRAFVDGRIAVVPPEMPQGVFSKLWVPDPSDPFKVR